MSRARTAQAARIGEAVMRQARSHIAYGSEGAPTGKIFEGFDAETPAAGFYAISLRSGAVKVGVRIWHGPPRDPHTGDIMDRHWRWQATANGEYIDLERVWPQCARSPISEAEHDHLCRLQAWGREHDPDGALADPTKPIDPLTAPVTF